MSANHETHGGSRSDLDWLAFQYIAGELSVDDEEQFEARLSTEPAVGEAVARVVALGEAVCRTFADATSESTPDCPAIRSTASGSRELAIQPGFGAKFSVLTATCVIVAALLISFRGNNAEWSGATTVTQATPAETMEGSPQVGVTPSEHKSLLLQTWTDARESIAALDGDVLTEIAAIELAEPRADLDGDVPDWMFVAVELSYGSGPGDSNGNVLEN
jgi:anti-sigma factor RsiW